MTSAATATATRKRSGPKPAPIEQVDGSWTFKPRRVVELAAVIEPGHLLYVAPAPFGARWDARCGEAPRFANLEALLADRGISLAYAGCYYYRAVALVTP
ncbi:MAG: hypothetical protein NT062_06410 [Proteobacteria bacterium]|nr:hypothetical protein [Pseudomonadota bacterium]